MGFSGGCHLAIIFPLQIALLILTRTSPTMIAESGVDTYIRRCKDRHCLNCFSSEKHKRVKCVLYNPKKYSADLVRLSFKTRSKNSGNFVIVLTSSGSTLLLLLEISLVR